MIDAVPSGGMGNVRSLMQLGQASTPAEEAKPVAAEERTEEADRTEAVPDDSIEHLLAGKVRNVDEVIHRLANADPTLQAMIRTRGKIASAYQEMMGSR